MFSGNKYLKPKKYNITCSTENGCLLFFIKTFKKKIHFIKEFILDFLLAFYCFHVRMHQGGRYKCMFYCIGIYKNVKKKIP